MATQEANVHPTVRRANAAVGRLSKAGIAASAEKVAAEAKRSRKGE
jgi:hypothetical protein